MSTKTMAWAWSLQIKSNLKFILLALADHSDDLGRCWPGLEGIAEKCCLSKSALCNSLKILIEMRLVFKYERRLENGQQLKNIYVLNLLWRGGEGPDSGQGGVLIPDGGEGPDSGPPPYNYIYNINNIDPDLNTIVQIENLDTKVSEKKPVRKKSLKADVEEIQTLFATLWALYPKKEQKKRAYKIFQKISPSHEVFEKMIKHIQAREAQWKKEIQFCPLLSTWLNDERWEDEIPPMQKGGALETHPRINSRKERNQQFWDKEIEQYNNICEGN